MLKTLLHLFSEWREKQRRRRYIELQLRLVAVESSLRQCFASRDEVKERMLHSNNPDREEASLKSVIRMLERLDYQRTKIEMQIREF
jgi:hypothetical protein